MFRKLAILYNKHKDLVLYVIFGGLTTLVDFAVFYPCNQWLQISGTVSNVIAWTAAVLFAYLTNKPFVFESHDWSWGTVLPELGKFAGGRLGSGLLQTLIIALTVDVLGWNGMLMKAITSVAVIILNFFISKLLVFSKQKKGT